MQVQMKQKALEDDYNESFVLSDVWMYPSDLVIVSKTGKTYTANTQTMMYDVVEGEAEISSLDFSMYYYTSTKAKELKKKPLKLISGDSDVFSIDLTDPQVKAQFSQTVGRNDAALSTFIWHCFDNGKYE